MDRLSFATLHKRLDTLSHSKVVGGVGIGVRTMLHHSLQSFLHLQLYNDETCSQFEDSNESFPTSATVL